MIKYFYSPGTKGHNILLTIRDITTFVGMRVGVFFIGMFSTMPVVNYSFSIFLGRSQS